MPAKFDPTAPLRSRGRSSMRNIRCSCGGVFFDVTISLAAHMGVRQYQCDICSKRHTQRISAKR